MKDAQKELWSKSSRSFTTTSTTVRNREMWAIISKMMDNTLRRLALRFIALAVQKAAMSDRLAALMFTTSISG